MILDEGFVFYFNNGVSPQVEKEKYRVGVSL